VGGFANLGKEEREGKRGSLKFRREERSFIIWKKNR